MGNEKSQLFPFTLKLGTDIKNKIKILCAVDEGIQFQYQLFDEAVFWALENKAALIPVANPKDGGYASYYVSTSKGSLTKLQEAWNCNETRALYSALVHYLQHRREDALIGTIVPA